MQKKAHCSKKKTHEAFQVLRSFVPEDLESKTGGIISSEKQHLYREKAWPCSPFEEGLLVENIMNGVNDLIINGDLIM
jgi:hypothetical protein